MYDNVICSNIQKTSQHYIEGEEGKKERKTAGKNGVCTPSQNSSQVISHAIFLGLLKQLDGNDCGDDVEFEKWCNDIVSLTT